MPDTPPHPFVAAADPEVDLVLLGGDIGIYALARAFHEKYGTIATVVTRKVAGPVADSSILRTVELSMAASEDDMVQALLKVGADKASRPGGTRPVLLANADFLVALMAAHREELGRLYHLPLLEDEVLAAVADKATFSQMCTEIDVPTPRTEVLDFSSGTAPEVPELDLGWPLVAKASRSSAYNAVSFPGKRKVFEIEDRHQLADLVARLTAAGYRDRFVLQEMIPGDDTSMLSVTAYVDTRGTVTLLGGAQVLLEEHTPGEVHVVVLGRVRGLSHHRIRPGQLLAPVPVRLRGAGEVHDHGGHRADPQLLADLGELRLVGQAREQGGIDLGQQVVRFEVLPETIDEVDQGVRVGQQQCGPPGRAARGELHERIAHVLVGRLGPEGQQIRGDGVLVHRHRDAHHRGAAHPVLLVEGDGEVQGVQTGPEHDDVEPGVGLRSCWHAVDGNRAGD